MNPQVKILRASAGSGKTYQLSYQYVRHVVDNPLLYRHILAVTFTNKATEEMKSRILSDLNDLSQGANRLGNTPEFMALLTRDLGLTPAVVSQRAQEALGRILHDYSRFSVQTIDKFFQKIVRSFIKELGIEVDYTIDFDSGTLLELAVDRLIDQTAENKELQQWITRFTERSISEGRSWDLRKGLKKLGEAIFSEAFDQHDSPENRAQVSAFVEALTQQAEKERLSLKSKGAQAVQLISNQGLTTADFYYGATGFANYFYKIAQGKFEDYGSRVRDVVKDSAKWSGSNKATVAATQSLKAQLLPLLQEICSGWDSNKKLFRTAALCQKTFHSFVLLTDINRNVIQLCQEKNIMLLSQTNILLHNLIDGNDAPFIYEKTGNAYSHFMIDEFQDTSLKQWANFLPLITNAIAETESERENVLLVGDVKQSIYRWRGGDWKILGGEASAQIGQERISTDVLATNWRSKERIVRFNNALIRRCIDIDNAQLNDLLKDALAENRIEPETHHALVDMLAHAYQSMEQETAPKNRTDQGFVQVVRYEHEQNIDRLIELVKELQERGYRASDIAILTRTNAQATTYAQALLEHKTRLAETQTDTAYCFDVVSQEALLLGSSSLVRALIAMLTLAVEGDHPVSVLTFNQFIGKGWSTHLTYSQKHFFNSLRERPLQEAFEVILYKFALGEQPDEIPYLQALHEVIISFSEKNTPDISLFVRWWNEKDKKGRDKSKTLKIYLPSEQEAIRLLTIHKSKGLQFKVVILPECQWSLIPNKDSVLWASVRNPLLETGEMLLPYEQSMGESLFGDDYYRETVLSHVDNLNMLYVALTRAEAELHLMVPKAEKNNIAHLLEQSIQQSPYNDAVGMVSNSTLNDSNTATFDPERSIEGTLTEDGTFLYGAPTRHNGTTQHTASSTVYINSYASNQFSSQIKTRLKSERYFADTQYETSTEKFTTNLSSRDYGVLMHQVFSNVTDRNSMESTFRRLRQNGDINDNDLSVLRLMMEHALSDPLIASWFDNRWQVHNEHEIILPTRKTTHTKNETSSRRPDRVVVEGHQAVVIDYKFGFKENKFYIRQVQEYMQLLRRMGYTDVKGYLWYVQQNRVMEVSS